MQQYQAKEGVKIFTGKKLKKKFQKALEVPEVKKMQTALLHSHKNAQINGIYAEVIKSCFKELKKQGYKEIKYNWNGKTYIADFKTELKSMEKFIEQENIC